MQKLLLLLLIACLGQLKAGGQSAAEKAILKILDDQTLYWNKGDLNNFVKGYWNNDSLMFIGSSGVVYGYQNTLTRYKKSYSDTSKMGRLRFEILHIKNLSPEYYYVVGKWFLKRSIGDLSGHYTLLIRKIKGEWKIVADHSS
ncbi:DUF4440 domain-containing protein [Agriterribacter sp.]|uniref:YybH family protein n=1 Tax=Agriterribacter sp. TaxID=2821509 RepID=UPI002C18A598|nr:DUF4440 domain-containing protein [Agriterribacter sp.]HRO44467.1 DUF4440 domain-containing protein [Agriterribacter sp.]HRQ16507.1 DUF4440 domain-containing protein [Agriterribacter sp.]